MLRITSPARPTSAATQTLSVAMPPSVAERWMRRGWADWAATPGSVATTRWLLRTAANQGCAA